MDIDAVIIANTTDTAGVDITVTTVHTEITTAIAEADIIQVTLDPAISIIESRQVGILQRHGDIPSELGNKTCRYGFI